MTTEVLRQQAQDLFQMGFIQEQELAARLNDRSFESFQTETYRCNLLTAFGKTLTVSDFDVQRSNLKIDVSSIDTDTDAKRFQLQKVKSFVSNECKDGKCFFLIARNIAFLIFCYLKTKGCQIICCSRCAANVPNCMADDHKSVCFVAFEPANDVEYVSL
jgi:hypothetical protein